LLSFLQHSGILMVEGQKAPDGWMSTSCWSKQWKPKGKWKLMT